jgi:hypothetical protein
MMPKGVDVIKFVFLQEGLLNELAKLARMVGTENEPICSRRSKDEDF